MLLQVLDDGRLTDGQGRTVDFRNTLIIMTSNLGSEYLVNQPEGEDSDAVREQVMDVVRAHFRPEFLNRVDEIILFHRLKRDQMTRIVDIQMKRLAKLLADRKLEVDLDDKAKEWLGHQGLRPGLWRAAPEARHPEICARPARRADPARQDPRRRQRQDHRRQGRPRHQRPGGEAGGLTVLK